MNTATPFFIAFRIIFLFLLREGNAVMGKQALHVYTIEDSEQWDGIVRTFKIYDIYYLSGYVKAFQIHGDGDPLLNLTLIS